MTTTQAHDILMACICMKACLIRGRDAARDKNGGGISRQNMPSFSIFFLNLPVESTLDKDSNLILHERRAFLLYL